MQLKLKVLDGKHAGQDVPVPGNRFFIGRAEDCQLRPGSDLISRHHCVLLVDDSYVGVRDLGSKNGTYVNSERIVGEQELHAGDRLKIGPLEFEVVLSTGVGGKKRPAVTGGIIEAATRAASNTTSADDVDVAQWLTTEDDKPTQTVPAPVKAGRSSDTEEIEISSTKEVKLADLGLLPPAEEATIGDESKIAEESKSAGPKTDPKAKKPPGKLPFSAQRIQAADSRDAAAKVLQMMKKRR